MKGSLLIALCFLGGVMLGRFVDLPAIFLGEELTLYVLYALIFLVGISIGSDQKTLSALKQQNWRIFLVPMATWVGTFGGMVLISLVLGHRSLTDYLAVGAGFGYYSLSGILVTEARGAELGTLALLTNILREIMTLVGAPLLCRWFSPLAPITSGGCTTEDTTLPVIARVCGSQFVPLSIFHGLTIDFAVPFLVSFFCTM